MLAKPLSALLDRYGIHYGWVVVGIIFLTTLTTAGSVGIPGALMLPLAREFGWDPAQISSALAIRLILFGLMAPFAAALMERYGVRRMIVIAIGLIITGLCGALVMRQLWHLVLAWGIIVGIGTGMTALVLSAVISNRWFTARRGLVVGILAASTSTGQLVFLPMTAALAESYGWRAALLPPIAALVTVALIVFLFVADRPSDLGLARYGDTDSSLEPAPVKTSLNVAFGRAFEVLGDVAFTPVFLIMFATFFVCGLSTNGLIQTHFISFCADYGVASVAAAGVLAAMGVCDIFGTIGSGWLSDRVSAGKLLCCYYGFRGLSLLLLPSSGFTFYGLSLFALFYGLDWIATLPPTVKLAVTAYGRTRAPIVVGWSFTGHQMGAATAAFGAGLSRTELSTYLPAFYIAGVACLFAAALALLARPESAMTGERPAALKPQG
jgi:predicted MFS family arabinose efflux permease